MPKTSNGDIVILVGRESIEALGTGEPVKVGDNEYLIGADSYDYPYRRIAELEAALRPFAKLADEIEACAGPNGNPDDWAKACTWPDLVAARTALWP